MKRNYVIACIAAAAVLAAGGTATGVALADGGGSGTGSSGAATATTASARTGTPAANTSGSGGGVATIDRVVHAAQASEPGTVTSAELDHGRWEVDLYGKDKVWHEIHLDRGTGKVIASRTDGGDQDDRKGAPVTATRAAAAARGAVAGTVTSVELDNGRWEAEVTAHNGARHEVYIDLTTGKVTSEHLNRHQHDGDDDGDDD
ncbi:peptidase M4 [Streptomyces sp. SID10853]|uniref:PepSY domain-containing protein n=1 Tax=Streptomyces sp. SID10853 TaxID=2706028 RepID=UPI0013C14997|nr:PepSY domain-containing protein [Streptomyces sp. SID10853]NDZ82466.1 peptidase M4 [Streptomyces sp. SID10853]